MCSEATQEFRWCGVDAEFWLKHETIRHQENSVMIWRPLPVKAQNAHIFKRYIILTESFQ